MLVQERLHDCRAGDLTHTLQPILPQNPNTKCLLGLRPPLAKWVPKPIQRQRAPKLRRDPEGGQLDFTAPFKKRRGRFSRTYSPVSQCPCRSRARRGVRGETRAACARAQWHTQNGMPREEHLDKAQKSEEQLTQTRKGEELTLSCI